MQDLISEIVDWRKKKGFITPAFKGNKNLLLGKLMLVVTELAEAAEAVRRNNLANFKEELADATIRIFDIAGTSKIHLENEIRAKMRVNKGRPFRHGTVTKL